MSLELKVFNVFAFVSLTVAASAAHATTYHLDAEGGDNAANGLTPQSAWRSLEKVAHLRLKPGDKVLLKSGSAWKGTLRIEGVGEKDRPVVLGRYGEGPLPVINGNGSRRALLIENPGYFRVQDLELKNTGEWNKALRDGLSVV